MHVDLRILKAQQQTHLMQAGARPASLGPLGSTETHSGGLGVMPPAMLRHKASAVHPQAPVTERGSPVRSAGEPGSLAPLGSTETHSGGLGVMPPVKRQRKVSAVHPQAPVTEQGPPVHSAGEPGNDEVTWEGDEQYRARLAALTPEDLDFVRHDRVWPLFYKYSDGGARTAVKPPSVRKKNDATAQKNRNLTNVYIQLRGQGLEMISADRYGWLEETADVIRAVQARWGGKTRKNVFCHLLQLCEVLQRLDAKAKYVDAWRNPNATPPAQPSTMEKLASMLGDTVNV